MPAVLPSRALSEHPSTSQGLPPFKDLTQVQFPPHLHQTLGFDPGLALTSCAVLDELADIT